MLRNVVDVDEKSTAVSVSVVKSRRAVATARWPATNSTRVSLADFLVFAQQEAADLAGVGDVRASAGGEIEVVDVDEAQFVALGGRKFPQAKVRSLVTSDKADVDGTILEDDFVGQASRRLRFDFASIDGVSRSMEQ